MKYKFIPTAEQMDLLMSLEAGTSVPPDRQIDYALELLAGEYDWDADAFLDNLKKYSRRHRGRRRPYAGDPDDVIRSIARQLHDGFFADDQWGDVDDVQRKLTMIYSPLVEAGYLKPEGSR